MTQSRRDQQYEIWLTENSSYPKKKSNINLKKYIKYEIDIQTFYTRSFITYYILIVIYLYILVGT